MNSHREFWKTDRGKGPEEAGVGIEECRLNFCEKAEQKFQDGGRAMEWCLKRAKEYYLSK